MPAAGSAAPRGSPPAECGGVHQGAGLPPRRWPGWAGAFPEAARAHTGPQGPGTLGRAGSTPSQAPPSHAGQHLQGQGDCSAATLAPAIALASCPAPKSVLFQKDSGVVEGSGTKGSPPTARAGLREVQWYGPDTKRPRAREALVGGRGESTRGCTHTRLYQARHTLRPVSRQATHPRTRRGLCPLVTPAMQGAPGIKGLAHKRWHVPLPGHRWVSLQQEGRGRGAGRGAGCWVQGAPGVRLNRLRRQDCG